MAENLLDIVTTVARPTFTVDGEPHELRNPEELSMTELRRLSHLGSELKRLGGLAEDEVGSPDALIDQIEERSSELLNLIAPDLPDAVRTKLNIFHILKIVQAFMALVPTSDSQDEQLTKAS